MMVRLLDCVIGLLDCFTFEVGNGSYKLVLIKFVGYLINPFWLVRHSEGLKWARWDLNPLGKLTGFPKLIARAIDLS